MKTILLLLLCTTFAAPAQEAPKPDSTKNSVLDAVQSARRRTGRQIVKLVQMTARDAVPYPEKWDMKFYDPASTTFLSDVIAGDRAVPSKSLYAEGLPPTYFDLDRVKIDVVKAFETVDAQARDAKVGFDKLDYTLRAREFSQEPVWTLRLVNAEQQLVGTVELSAENGRIYRTIWLRRAGGDIQIEDSSLGTDAAVKKEPTDKKKPIEEESVDGEGENPTTPIPATPTAPTAPKSQTIAPVDPAPTPAKPNQ